MPLIIVAPTIVRYSFHKTLSGGHKYTNVIDISVEALTGTSREDAIADFNSHISGWYQDNFVAGGWGLTAQTYTGGSYVDLDSPTGTTGSFGPAGGHPVTGTNASAPTSPQVSFLLHCNSAARRGQRQGRLYLGPVSESDVDGAGVVSSSLSTQLHTAAEAFRSAVDTYNSVAVESAAWRTVHVHKPDPHDSGTWTWSSSTIDSTAVDPQIATQRRRNR